MVLITCIFTLFFYRYNVGVVDVSVKNWLARACADMGVPFDTALVQQQKSSNLQIYRVVEPEGVKGKSRKNHHEEDENEDDKSPREYEESD